MSLSGVAAKVVDFVRAGYPEVAPSTGYIPLLALSRRRLCDDEVWAVAAEFAARGDAAVDDADIGAAIMRITRQLPAVEDIERIKSYPPHEKRTEAMATPVVQAEAEARPMRTVLHARLDRLTVLLSEMCALAGTQMKDATAALLQADLALADEVISGHDRLVELNQQAEESSVALLALQAPVAGDLRCVVGSLQSAADAERMGALALHVAEIARRRHPSRALPEELTGYFAELGRLAVDLGDSAREAVLACDPVRAAQIHDDDDAVDHLHRHLFTVLMDREWTHDVAATVDVALLGRFYERFADHAVHIGRRVIFQATGSMGYSPSSDPSHHRQAT